MPLRVDISHLGAVLYCPLCIYQIPTVYHIMIKGPVRNQVNYAPLNNRPLSPKLPVYRRMIAHTTPGRRRVVACVLASVTVNVHPAHIYKRSWLNNGRLSVNQYRLIIAVTVGHIVKAVRSRSYLIPNAIISMVTDLIRNYSTCVWCSCIHSLTFASICHFD